MEDWPAPETVIAPIPNASVILVLLVASVILFAQLVPIMVHAQVMAHAIVMPDGKGKTVVYKTRKPTAKVAKQNLATHVSWGLKIFSGLVSMPSLVKRLAGLCNSSTLKGIQSLWTGSRRYLRFLMV